MSNCPSDVAGVAIANGLIGLKTYREIYWKGTFLGSHARKYKNKVNGTRDLANRAMPDELNREKQAPKFDFAKALAKEEQQNIKIADRKDSVMKAVEHDNGPPHVHIEKAAVAGPYNMSIYIEGDYCPDHDVASGHEGTNDHNHAGGSSTQHKQSTDKPSKMGCDSGCLRESFSRILSALVPVTYKKV